MNQTYDLLRGIDRGKPKLQKKLEKEGINLKLKNPQTDKEIHQDYLNAYWVVGGICALLIGRILIGYWRNDI